jgi:hypothetical protein
MPQIIVLAVQYNVAMLKKGLLAALLIISCVHSAKAAANRVELITKPGQGYVLVEGDDYIDAKRRAKDTAASDALWKAILELSSFDQAEKRKDLINALILKDAMNFTHSYRYFDERIDTAVRAYFISLEFSFFSDELSQALKKIGVKVKEHSKAVVVVEEGVMDAITASSFLLTSSLTENMLKDVFENNGYIVINRVKLRSLKKEDDILKAIKGDQTAVKWLSGQYGADIVVVGTTSAGEAKSKTSGTVSIKVYNGTGELLWSKEQTETVESTAQTDRMMAVRVSAEKIKIELSEFLSRRLPAKKVSN